MRYMKFSRGKTLKHIFSIFLISFFEDSIPVAQIIRKLFCISLGLH